MKVIQKLLLVSATLMCVFNSCNLDSNSSLPGNGNDQNDPFVKKTWQNWIKQNSVPINSLSDEDFGDMRFLKTLIEDRRLVQLGENSHGVAEFNKLKVRLIKFLHEEMGFNVIAFESGIFECFDADIKCQTTSPSESIKALFSVWETEEVLDLFDYIKQTKSSNNPLTLAGFDFQMSGSWDNRHTLLSKMIAPYDPKFARELYVTDSLFALNKKPNDVAAMRTYVKKNQDELKRIYTRLELLIDQNIPQLTNRYSSNPLLPLFAHQVAISMLAYINFWLDEENEMMIRDRAMADNVDFLLNKACKNEKIILWAHNLHIRHNNNLIKSPPGDNIISMGTWLHKKHHADIYTIGLYMFKGQAAGANKEVYTVKWHSDNSLEAILHASGYKYCFVDLKYQKINSLNNWIDSETTTKTWGLNDLQFIPREQYDAILLIDEDHPPKYLD